MSAPDDTGLVNNLMGPHEWGYRDVTDGTFIADDAPYTAAARIEALTADVELLRSPPEIPQWRMEGLADVDLAFKVECVRRNLEWWLAWDRNAQDKPDDTVMPPTWPTRAVIAVWIVTLREAEQVARSLSRPEGEGG